MAIQTQLTEFKDLLVNHYKYKILLIYEIILVFGSLFHFNFKVVTISPLV